MKVLRSSFPIKADGRRERILLVQTSFFGDVVLTTPLIAEIKRRFPQAHLAVLCKAQVQGLLENNPAIDEVLAYDKAGTQRGLAAFWEKARELRQREFTIAISPHKSFRTALLLFLAGIPCRIGFRQSAGWFLYHYRASRMTSRHDVERNLSILAALGIDPSKCQKDLQLETDRAARQSVALAFQSCGIQKDEDRLLFGLSPGSVWPMKRWHLEGYAKVIRDLKKTYACEILLFGASEDRDTIVTLQQLTGSLGVDLVGRFSLRELPAAIDWCDLFICNDTGPMHVAVARGVPVVAIFCATTPSLGFYPYSSKAIVVEKDLHCRPCSPHGGIRCPLGTEDCIRLIHPEHVLE
ncbi:MAG: lipopolysaccharide heptosyltransferase II, partial [Candidatus Binatia bacterium]